MRILGRALLDGAAWETPTAQLVAQVSKTKKFVSERIGALQSKKIELNDRGDVPLDPDAATPYRALAARCRYLALDRPDLG